MSYLIYLLFIITLVFWLEGHLVIFPNSLIIRKDPGAELENWLKNFSWGPRQEPKLQKALPVYKFYSEIINVLLTIARKVGGSYQESLFFLRECLQADRQFEKKIKESVLGMWLQMLMMMTLTWIFIFGASSIVEASVGVKNLVFIFSWQLIGLVLLPLMLKFFRKKYFNDIGRLWKILFILKALARVPMARTELFHRAGVSDLSVVKQKSLLPLVSKLKESCQKSLKLGVSYEEDVKYLMEELRFQEKWHFELFEKRLTVIKLLLLSVFFLPSYLAFIFLLLGDLMTLM